MRKNGSRTARAEATDKSKRSVSQTCWHARTSSIAWLVDPDAFEKKHDLVREGVTRIQPKPIPKN
jgi:hypothetical protein